MNINRLFVIGGSAGALEALAQIISSMQEPLPVAVLVVLHLTDDSADLLQARLAGKSAFVPLIATNDDVITAGRLYIAPPDFHTMVHDGRIHLTRGPRVNLARPAIDLAFRSVAVAYRERAVGVILSGMLDDGAAGLDAIQQCGGVTIVQHPGSAAYPEMPNAALASVEVDYTAEPTQIQDILMQLAFVAPSKNGTIPPEVALENRFDLNGVDDMAAMERLGRQIPMVCPECNGPLWEVDQEGIPRFRCHIGHSVSAYTMLASQREEIERALWIALRTLEEKARMQERLGEWETASGRQTIAASFQKRATETRAHIEQLRRFLLEMGNDEFEGEAETL